MLAALLLQVALAVGSPQSNDSLQAVRAAMELRADSLRAQWDVLWKRSDSIRIESMFLRMRSDSLRRVARRLVSKPDTSTNTPDTSATVPDTNVVIVKTLAQRARSGRVRSGQTLSDSLTRSMMMAQPDTGTASFYANEFHGRKTSSGEVFNMNDRTCAHRWLPYNTRVRITNLDNGKSTIVRVNDRGPFKHTRIVDVSKGAAEDLGMVRSGTARVQIQVVVDSVRTD